MVIALSPLAGISLSPLIFLIAGILILVVPRLLNFIVAIYLIIIGLVGVFHLWEESRRRRLQRCFSSSRDSRSWSMLSTASLSFEKLFAMRSQIQFQAPCRSVLLN